MCCHGFLLEGPAREEVVFGEEVAGETGGDGGEEGVGGECLGKRCEDEVAEVGEACVRGFGRLEE